MLAGAAMVKSNMCTFSSGRYIRGRKTGKMDKVGKARKQHKKANPRLTTLS